MNTLQGLLTPQEVADRLRVSKRTIRRYTKSGELPQLMRIGRNAYYHPDTIREFINQHINREDQP